MEGSKKPTLGLALSGSGNRTTFYIGFLEVLDEAGITIDYISACSGGSLVAAAYACGTMPELKEMTLGMKRKDFFDIATKKRGQGGLYSLDELEKLFWEKFTKGLHFDEVKPLMTFVAVDIENGEPVDLCIGDIAKAARISCTVPGIFEPVQWGSRTLVDGGVLMLMPVEPLKKFDASAIVGISTGGTKHVFSKGLLNLKKVLDFFKKSLYLKEMKFLIESFYTQEDGNEAGHPELFASLGKSLDLAISANSKMDKANLDCDLIVEMKIPKVNKIVVNPGNLKKYYELGREAALANVPKIKELINSKS